MRLLEGIKIYCATRGLAKTPATIKGEDMDLRLLCLYLRNPEIGAITEDHVVGYLLNILELGWTENGTYKKSCVFRNFWRFANKKGWPSFNADLIPIVKKPVTIPHVGKPEEYMKVMRVVPSNDNYDTIRNKSIISLLWHTGARNGEICSLNLKDLDIDKRRALIKTEKSRGNRPFREIFWDDPHDEAHKYLMKWLEKRKEVISDCIIKEGDEDALFLSRPYSIFQRIANATVDRMLRVYSKKAHVPTLNPHSFRHHFAHDMVVKGANNSDLMNLLGHARLESSRPYTQMYHGELHDRYKHFKGLKS